MPEREPKKENKAISEERREIKAKKERILNKPAKFKHLITLEQAMMDLERRMNMMGIYLKIQEQVICEKRTRLPGLRLFKKGQWKKRFDKIFKGIEKETEEAEETPQDKQWDTPPPGETATDEH